MKTSIAGALITGVLFSILVFLALCGDGSSGKQQYWLWLSESSRARDIEIGFHDVEAISEEHLSFLKRNRLPWFSLNENEVACRNSTHYGFIDVNQCVSFNRTELNLPWCLQSFEEDGHPKWVGGDDLYISLLDEDHVKIGTGWIIDLMNGRYLLEFDFLQGVE